MKLHNTPQINGNQASLTFQDFSLNSYQDFISIRSLPTYKVTEDKIEFPANYVDGFYQETVKIPLEVTPKLFDYQQVIAKVSFIKQRYGIFLDPGLGKTLALGEVARQVNAIKPQSKILYVTALNILNQSREMCINFSECLDCSWAGTPNNGQCPVCHSFNIKLIWPDFPASINLHNSKMSLKEWALMADEPIAFINHEAFIKIEELPRNIELVLLDEASILKGGQGGNGKIAKNLIASCKFVPRRIAASGTPAPNDKTEYAMIALWLGYVNSEKEFYSMYFVNKDGEYVLRRHATEKFYQYLASWSIFMRSPAAYGFENNLKDLKPWQEIHQIVDMTEAQNKLIARYAKKGKQPYLPGIAVPPSDMGQRSKFSQISKGFAYNGEGETTYVESNKPQVIHEIIQSHNGKQVIVWTVFDEEGDILERKLNEEGYRVAHITGKTKADTRLQQIDAFRHGELDVIISKPRILGFGLNFQFCYIEIFSGLQDSYEQYFQAVKRVHRYGQKEQVLIYLVYTAYEEVIIQNVLKKQKSMEQDFNYQEKLYIGSLADELKDFLLLEDYSPMAELETIKYEPIITNDYQLYHGDSIKIMLMIRDIHLASGSKVEKAKELAKEYGMKHEVLWQLYESLVDKVELSVFSPPFPGDVFTYSRDPADMGNTRGAGAVGGMDDFMLQFQFFLEGMKIVTKAGRFMAMHLEDVPLRKGLDGNVGLFDVTGEVTRAAAKTGWILKGKIPIIKNQQMQSIVKHVSNLAMGNMEKDRLRIAPAMNGTMLLFQKPGESDRMVTDLAKCLSCGWQGYAQGIVGYDSKTTRSYKMGETNALSFANCPKCDSSEIEIHSEMYGDKWIMYAEGAWPEEGFNQDFGKLSKIPREERWLNLVQTALGVWFDVQEGETLGLDRGRNFHETEDADKHLCPLPVVVVQRPIEMYTLPGELVFTPFSGSGTCLDRAIRANRKVIGIELKPEYFVMSSQNAEKAIKESQQLTLFDLDALRVTA